MAQEDPLLVSQSSDNVDPLSITKSSSQPQSYNRTGRPTLTKAIRFCPQPKSIVSQLLSKNAKNRGSFNDTNLHNSSHKTFGNNAKIDNFRMPVDASYQTAGIAAKPDNLTIIKDNGNSPLEKGDVFSEDNYKCKKVKCKILNKPKKTHSRKFETSNSRRCPNNQADVIAVDMAEEVAVDVAEEVAVSNEYCCDAAGCNYKSKLFTNLTKHKRIHSNEKPYMCEKCPFRSNYVNSLKAHRRIHTYDLPYCCHLCGYRCNSTSNLKKHILLKHRN